MFCLVALLEWRMRLPTLNLMTVIPYYYHFFPRFSYSSWHSLHRCLFEVRHLFIYIFIIVALYIVLHEKHFFAYLYGLVVEVVPFLSHLINFVYKM